MGSRRSAAGSRRSKATRSGWIWSEHRLRNQTRTMVPNRAVARIRSTSTQATGECLAGLVLLLMAIPIAAIVAIVMAAVAHSRLTRLEARLDAMQRRLARLAAAPDEDAAPSEPRPAPPSEPSWRPIPPGPEPAPPIPPAPPPIAASASVPPTTPRMEPQMSELPGLEERFGTRWVVWVGGIALALGGIFLVRYSIERGLIGPGLRVALGGLLAAGLIAAGEWARRKENLSGLPSLPTA